MSTDFTVWVAAFMTLGVYSFLYKENPWYRFIESAYIGLAAGYAVVMGYANVLNKAWQPLMQGKLIVLVPIFLGLLLFGRFLPNFTWTSRIPLAYLVGMGAAIALRGSVQAEFVGQIQAQLVAWKNINDVLVFFGVIGVLIFFLFTFKISNPAVKGLSGFGRATLMACFGATFAANIMLRISLFIGRLQFLFGEWIHLIQ